MKIGFLIGTLIAVLGIATQADAQLRMYPNATSAYRYGNVSGPDWGNGYTPAPVHRNYSYPRSSAVNPGGYSFGSGSTGMIYDREYGSNLNGTIRSQPSTASSARWYYYPPTVNYGPYRPHGYGFGYGYRGW